MRCVKKRIELDNRMGLLGCHNHASMHLASGITHCIEFYSATKYYNFNRQVICVIGARRKEAFEWPTAPSASGGSIQKIRGTIIDFNHATVLI
jgi:hypothetical protein